MRFPKVILVLVLGLGACSGGLPAGSSTTTEKNNSTVPNVDPEGLIAPCLMDPERFVDSGSLVIGDGVGDAGTLSAIVWDDAAGCDRLTVNFLTESGAPASAVGASIATLSPERGIIRIEYPENVTSAGPIDLATGTDLVGAAYVVRTREGRLAADFHLTGSGPVAFHADTSTSPANSILDVRPIEGDGSAMAVPITTNTVVLLTPTITEATYPIRVSGYTRSSDGEVLIRYVVDGRVVAERRTVAAGDPSTWGEFSIIIDDGPMGSAQLYVGAVSGDIDDGIIINLSVQ